MIRYRCESGTTYAAAKHFHNVHRIGRIISIEGLRFRSRRSYLNESGERVYWENTHERVKVRGVLGYANFSGVCWGYGGSGPHNLIKLLKECGISQGIAEDIAFNTHRGDKPGVDWRIELPVIPHIIRPHVQLTLPLAG